MALLRIVNGVRRKELAGCLLLWNRPPSPGWHQGRDETVYNYQKTRQDYTGIALPDLTSMTLGFGASLPNSATLNVSYQRLEKERGMSGTDLIKMD